MKIADRVQRSLYVVASCLLVGVATFSAIRGHAAAATQITARSITMSNSNAGTTGVTYKVSFKAAASYQLKGIVVDFCDNDPLPGDTCTLPTGFSLTASPAIANASPSVAWTAASSNSNRTLTLTNTTGTALTAGTTVVSFEVTTVANPTTDNHSFYARIFTYTSTTTGYTDGQSSANEGAFTEYGGIALSTGKVINITAKVQETLSFCVYNTACGDDPSFTLGHTAGTATVIDNSVVDTSTAKFSISTNANGGVAVRMKGDTLKSGSNSIAAKGATAGAITAGTANFGLYLSALGTNMSATAPYTTSASNYAFDVSSAGTSDVTTTYGGQLAALSGPTTASVTTITFGATASPTTPAGTYTAAEQLIAAGTF